jgi:hydroxymethylpyrimidine kinase / phosphomethylpyrimidine kinase / thiamine-phosphate diphosphorylase
MVEIKSRIPCVVSIAGSDSGGGAGIQADLKTMCARGVYGATVITALTAQNTLGVQSVHPTPPAFVAAQLDSVLSDIPCTVAKIGMLPSVATVHAVADALIRHSVKIVVLDPVMVSTSGHGLVDGPDVVVAIRERLFPITTVLTPNLPEASCLLGWCVEHVDDMRRACLQLHALGPQSVFLKGGHLTNGVNPARPPETATDVLYDGSQFEAVVKPWLVSRNTHGTGCSLASAIASELAKGQSLYDATRIAKEYVHCAIAESFDVGQGQGPINHMHGLIQYQYSE